MEQRELIKLAIIGASAQLEREAAAAIKATTREAKILAELRQEKLRAQFAELVEMGKELSGE